MLNIRSRRFDRAQWLDMLIKFSKQLGNSFEKVIKVLCYLQFLKNTEFVRIVLNHF